MATEDAMQGIEWRVKMLCKALSGIASSVAIQYLA